MIFGEDDRRIAEGHAPQNFSLLTKMALNLLRQDTSEPKKSLRSRLKQTGWNINRIGRLFELSELWQPNAIALIFSSQTLTTDCPEKNRF